MSPFLKEMPVAFFLINTLLKALKLSAIVPQMLALCLLFIYFLNS